MSKKTERKTVPFGSTTRRPEAVDLYKVPHEAASRSLQNPNALPFPVDPETGKKREHSPGAVGGRSGHSSLASTDSTAATKTVQGKKDHTHCNKRIADLEKELRIITTERNQLLRRRKHPAIAITPSEETETESDKGDPLATITMLTSKLDVFENLEVDFDCLKDYADLLEARDFQRKTEWEQLGAEHDAESEKIKLEYKRQIEELHQNHTAALVRLESEHSAHISEIQAAHQEQLSRLEVSQDHLESERSRLHQKCEEIGLTLETKLCEIEELKTQLEFEKDRLERVGRLLQNK